MDREMRKRLARDAAGLPEPRQMSDAAFASAVEDLVAFVRDRGRPPEPGSGQPAEARLGTWLDAQRRADRKGRLSADRSGALEHVLGPGWSSNR
jgi:hypothetical protein